MSGADPLQLTPSEERWFTCEVHMHSPSSSKFYRECGIRKWDYNGWGLRSDDGWGLRSNDGWGLRSNDGWGFRIEIIHWLLGEDYKRNHMTVTRSPFPAIHQQDLISSPTPCPSPCATAEWKSTTLTKWLPSHHQHTLHTIGTTGTHCTPLTHWHTLHCITRTYHYLVISLVSFLYILFIWVRVLDEDGGVAQYSEGSGTMQ